MAVRRLREERGWTQDDLVRMSGDRLTRSTVQNLESGRSVRPRAQRYAAEAFGIGIAELRRLAGLAAECSSISPDVLREIERSGLPDQVIIDAVRKEVVSRAS